MRTTTLSIFALCLVGCGPMPGNSANSGDDDSPLSTYDSVFHGAPDNSSLPNEGKADDVYAKQFTELLAFQSPVKNQASRGVCTIFSSVGLMEHLYRKAGMENPNFSEQYLNWSVKVELGAYADSEGSNNDENLTAVHKFGIVESAVYPYNPSPWTEANDADCKASEKEDESLPTKCWTQGDPSDEVKKATKFTLPEGRYLNTRSIKSHMTKNHTAVVVGLDFFYQSWNHGRSTLPVNSDSFAKGIVLNPNEKDVSESKKHRAGHGILLVGWDDELSFPQVDGEGKPVLDAKGNPVMETGFYYFKNSWGTGRFGTGNPNGPGYGYISQRYVEKYGSAYIAGVPSIDKPTTDEPKPATPTTCEYKCTDYGFVASQCYEGWACDAQGKCLTNVGECK